jgi:aminoglycoside phosphotransferase (APT) family kinase protein
MPHPWAAEIELDAQRVNTILAGALPELSVTRVRALGAGWDFAAFAVDALATGAVTETSAQAMDEWVFRFAKRGYLGRELAREVRLLQQLGSELGRRVPDGADIAIPRYRYHVSSTNDHPLPFGGYPMLRGQVLLDVSADAVDATAIGAQLGAWLRRVHASVPLRAPRRVPDYFSADLVEFRETFRQVRAKLPVPIERALGALLAKARPRSSDMPRFCHADLGVEHILVDVEASRITAVLDWTDARWDTPLVDFVGLWAWGGDAAVAAACRGYGRDLSAAEWHMLRLRGACHALGLTHYGHFAGLTRELRCGTAVLERMQQAGQLENCGVPDP